MVGPSSTSGRQRRPLGRTREPRLSQGRPGDGVSNPPATAPGRRHQLPDCPQRHQSELAPGVVERLPSLFFVHQDLPGLPMALRVSGRSTALPTCPVYVHGAAWPSGADASGFGNTGRGEPVGGGGSLPGPAEVFRERPVEPELGVSDDQDPGPAVRRPGEYGASEWSSPGSALRSERCAPGRSGGEMPARIGPHRPEWRRSWMITAHRRGSTVPPGSHPSRRPLTGAA